MIEPNPHLLQLNRVVERMDERAHYVCLDRNERVMPWPADVFGAMLQQLRPEDFCRYPDPTPLYERLSRVLQMPADHLYLTNGSDAAIRMVFTTYVRPGDQVVLPDPTYAMYPIYTQMYGGQVNLVPYNQAGHIDVGALLSLAALRPRLVALANPDQPTGAVHSRATLRRLAEVTRDSGSLLLIDEAYYPFFPETAVNLVREFNHVVVTRTFSKIGGLAGLRLGYFVAAPEIIQNVQRVRGAHEVNAVAIAAGSYVLDHPELAAKYLAEVEAGRMVLARAAEALGLGFPTCPANFQLLRLPGAHDPSAVCAALKEHGFLVKGGFGAIAVRDCIRVTLAGPETMNRFVDALKRVLAPKVDVASAT